MISTPSPLFSIEEVEQSIVARFEAQVRLHLQKPAIIEQGRAYTYDELNRRANRIANALQKSAPQKPSRIGIYLEKSFEYLASIFGVLKAGHAYVPVDPAFPEDRNLFILQSSQASAILTNREHETSVTALSEASTPVLRLEDIGQEYSDENPGLEISPDHLAYIIYTSGSTGKPKGVVQNHRNTLHGCMRRTNLQGITADDRMSLFYSCSVMGSVYCVFGALLNGAALLPYDFREEGLQDLADWLTTNRLTVYHSVASVFRQFASQFDYTITDSQVRLVIFGGERVLSSDVEAARRIFSKRVHFFTGLGSTETGTVRYFLIEPETQLSSRIVPIGYPVEGVDIVLTDSDGLEVPPGEVGEINIHSRYIALGYWNDEEATKKAFSEVPDRPGIRCYRMGDLAQLTENGKLEHRGRKDFQVKIRGFRVELGEVESAIQSHPLVSEGLAKAHEVGDEMQLVGYVVPLPGQDISSLNVRELRSHLKERLPSYMLPSFFVGLEVIPRTPNGKVDRNALPPPLPGNELAGDHRVPPKTQTEQVVVEICSQLLGRAELGTNQNFFDMGGDSLRATQVVARVRERLNVKLAMRAIFSAPDIAALCKHIDEQASADNEEGYLELVPRSPDSITPATPAQKRMWLVDKIYSGSSAYNISNAVRLKGSLDVAAMRRALTEMVHRHEILRTVFVSNDGNCIQKVLPPYDVELEAIDLRKTPASERRPTAHQLVRDHVGREHDLAKGPLFSSKLLVLDEDEHILSLVFNHIIYDNIWSSRIFFGELGKLYGHYHTYGTDASSPLDAIPFQFGDYAEWEKKRVEGTSFESQLAYWREQLSAPPPTLVLPSDRPEPKTPSFKGGQVEFALPAYVRLALAQFSREESATIFMCSLAAWQLLLMRYSKQQDIMVGTPTGRRYHAQTEEMIGLFINNLVLRAQFSDDMTFRDLVAQVRRNSIDAFSNDELPFEKLVELLRPRRNDGTPPFFSHFFIHRNATNSQWHIPGLVTEPLRQHQGGSKFDLTLSVLEEEQKISGTIEYSADLFDEDTVQRMAENYVRLLTDAIEHPTKLLQELELVAETERQELVAAGTIERTDYPREKCTHHLFEERVRATPHAVALVTPTETLTYEQLDRRANAVAARLRQSGVCSDTLVGVCLERNANLVVALLGVMKSGGAYVPLDPDFPPDRLEYMLEDSRAAVLLSEASVAKRLSNHGAEVIVVSDCSEVSEPCESAGRPADLAYVIYTSGSTGKPKGVQICHQSLTNFLWAMKERPGLSDRDVVQSITTICFDIAALELYLPLIVGARVVVSPRETALSPRALLESMRQHGVTLLQATPVTWRMLLEHGWTGDPKITVLCGGEAMGLPLAEKLVETGCTVWNMYGPTETTIWSTVGSVRERIDSTVVGEPIRNTDLYVMNDRLRLQPIGVPGELLIGGEGLARGYLNRDELTMERFVPNPLHDGERLYRTGDLVVKRKDGSIEFMGRIDNQVKVRGFRIELGEIETLLGDQAGVTQAVVVARPGDSGDNELVAYVQSDGTPLAGGTLRHALSKSLPGYMVPNYFVQLEEFPLTPNGKVDRKALPAPTAQTKDHRTPAPDNGAPRSPTEEILQKIWAKVLQIEPPGIHENFYDLGGHSLQAVRIVESVAAAGLNITPVQFFQNPTIAGLAEAATSRKQSEMGSDCLVALRERGERPPLFLFHSTPGDVVGYAELVWALHEDRPVYGFQSVGLKDPSQAHNSIPEMASHYAEEIIRLFPDGPCHLAGWCFGGTVALEVARQLEARRRKVGVVSLMEATPKVPRDAKFWLRRLGLAVRMGQEGGRVLVRGLQRRLNRTGVDPRDSEDVHVLSLSHGPFQHRRAVYDINLQAVRNHRTSYYPGTLTLMKSKYSRQGLRDEDFGWTDLVGNLHVHEFDSDHTNMLKAPVVNQLAAALSKCLKEGDDRFVQQKTESKRRHTSKPIPPARRSASAASSPPF